MGTGGGGPQGEGDAGDWERWVLSDNLCPGKEQAIQGPQETHRTMESPAGACGSCSDVKTQASPAPRSPPGSSLISPEHPGLHARSVHMLARRYTGTEGRSWRERGAATLHCVGEARVEGKPWRPEEEQRMGKCQKGGPGGGGAPGRDRG